MEQRNRRKVATLPLQQKDGRHRRTTEKPRLAAVPALDEPVKAPLISRSIVQGLATFGEGLVIIGLGIALMLLYVQPEDSFTRMIYGGVLVVGTLATLLLFRIRQLYTIESLLQPGQIIGGVGAAIAVVFAGLAGLMFLSKAGTQFSRVWLASWLSSSIVIAFLYRLAVARLLHRLRGNGRLLRRCVLVGGGEPARRLAEALETSASDIEIIGVFDDRDDHRSPATIGRHRKLGTISEVVDFARRSRVDLLALTFPLTAEARLMQVVKQLCVLPVDIRLSAHMQALRFRPRAYSHVGTVPFLDLADKPIANWDLLVKIIEDKLLAVIALLGLLPLMALTALAIKLDSRGPVLFRQRRYGFNNELIEVYKFRSMHVESADPDAARLVTRDDKRVTRVGRFLRKWSIDELPQLFNVLTGTLSLVGPRPHAREAKAHDRLYADVVDGYFARHRVKPGITGWAQINGWRGETDTEEKLARRVDHDLYYIENWSLMLDLFIIVATPFALLRNDNAY
ncbi:MAG: undecaprenyl-phosphate glucose phosphotransferase [Aestuariivirgaceae bacterium]